MRQLPLSAAARPAVLSVTQLCQRLSTTLDENFRQVWVAGEVSGCKPAPSGHWYFTLKDEQSQLAAVLFRSTAQQLRFKLSEGMAVVIRGRMALYGPRGNLQLYVDAVEPQGIGSLQLAFEQLKQRLAAEGLFDADRKRPLPYMPRTIGIVTGRRGAALHDMLVTLCQRGPGVKVIVRPALVQGREAPTDIVAALEDLARIPEIEVVIVGRGGGSLEDLWAFNDERVARAIAAAPFPIISGVGHEIDFTIADLVADLRAPTPTAAASAVVPDRHELSRNLAHHLHSLSACTLRQIRRHEMALEALRGRLRDPRLALQTLQVRVDELGDRLLRAMGGKLRRDRETVARFGAHLQALSPLSCLERGYALVRRADGAVVTRASQLNVGDTVEVILHQGRARARVESTD